MGIPIYWKTELGDIESAIKNVHIGQAQLLSVSAGGRNIYSVFYGKKNSLKRKANLSSALGAKSRSCYADKSVSDYRPTLLLVGGVHGGEFEGIAAILNVISIMENGADLNGENSYLRDVLEKINLILVPCINPDGRSRVTLKSMVGKTLETLRYYNQGTWKDKTLCNWPDCKKYHPIKEYADFLGGYFNDDGINLMHDDFFINPTEETRVLMRIADEYVPDLTVLLHGGINGANHILKPAYAPLKMKEEILELEKRMQKRLGAEEIRYDITALERGENGETPASFNLCSMLSHLCGEACITYESNQGLSGEGAMSYEKIYRSHIILFEECCNFILERSDKNEA